MWKIVMVMFKEGFVGVSDLIFIDFSVLQFSLALVLEGDNDQSHEDVDEEEWKHDEVDDVEDGHFNAVVQNRTVIFLSGRHRVLQDSAHRNWTWSSNSVLTKTPTRPSLKWWTLPSKAVVGLQSSNHTLPSISNFSQWWTQATLIFFYEKSSNIVPPPKCFFFSLFFHATWTTW